MKEIRLDENTTLTEILDYLSEIKILEIKTNELQNIYKKLPGVLEFFKLIYLKKPLFTFTSILKDGKIKLRPLKLINKNQYPITFNRFITKELPNYSDSSSIQDRVKRSKLMQSLDMMYDKDAELILGALEGKLNYKNKGINHILLKNAFPEVFSMGE